MRRLGALLAMLAVPAACLVADAAPTGQMTWAVHIALAPRWLDPSENDGSITSFMLLYAVHDALLKPMPGSPRAPSLALKWETSADGLVYTFTLRQGLQFHNGDALTAEDVKFTFERYRGANAQLLKDKVREVLVLGPLRVQFMLKEPWPDFIIYYGTTASSAGWIVPKKYIERVGDDGFRRAPVGAGPYKVVSFTPGVELVMEAYDGYWGKVPSVKRLVFRSMPDGSARAAALKNGDVDIAYLLDGPVAEDVQGQNGIKLKVVHSNAIFFLDFRDQWKSGSPWQDQRVRMAASLAIDRAALNETEQLGFACLSGSVVPRGFEFALPIEPDPYDPGKARNLLAAAGFPSGLDAGDLTVELAYKGAGQKIVKNFAAVGIRMTMRTMERAAFFSAWAGGTLRGVVLGGLGPAGNAATRLQLLAVKGAPYAAGVLPEIQDLFELQARELDWHKRRGPLQQIQRLLNKRTIFAPIWENGFVRGVGPRVEESALDLVPFYPYSAPYEELRLKP